MYKPKILLLLLILYLISLPAYAQITPNSLNITVYEDGVVQVEYLVSVDPTYPAVNISLLGQTFEDLIIVDENSVPLGYSLNDGIVTINTLGARSVSISYTTSDLTSKVGKYWSLNFSSPVITRIILPRGASIISLNSIPKSIESEDERTIIVMPEGRIEVTYVIGIVGTKEHSWAVILNAEKVIEDLKATGVIVDKAESLLSQAKEKFNEGSYMQAEELATQAENVAYQINKTASKALTAILKAEEAIAKAEKEGKDVSTAKELLDQAKSEFNLGNYDLASNLAVKAKAEAEKQRPVTYPSHIEILVIAAIIGIIIAFIVLRRPHKYKKEIRKVDLDKILKEKPGLRPEDQEAIEFLAEAGGEAFESEIREKFRLPRTTVWRMVKRLEREGLIEVRKVGGQNLIRIKKEFCD